MSGKSNTIIFLSAIAIAFAANRAEDARISSENQMYSQGRRVASLAQKSFVMSGAPSSEFVPSKPTLGLAGGSASVSKKSEKDFVVTREIHKHTHKLSGPLTSEIELIGTPPTAGDIFVLKGVITATSDPGAVVTYKWILPVGVELVNGMLEGSVEGLNAGESREVQVTLRQLSTENEQVHLQVSGGSDVGRFAMVSQHNTLLQKAIEEGYKEQLKKTEEHAAEHQQKIFH